MSTKTAELKDTYRTIMGMSPLIRYTCDVVLAAFLVAAPLVSFSGGRALWRSMAAGHWPQASATIVSSEVVEGPAGMDSNYTAAVTYTYMVDGQEYTSDAVQIQNSASEYHEVAQRIVNQFAKGNGASVYYNPRDPSEAYLLVGFRPWLLFMVIPPWLFFFMGAAWWYSRYQLWRHLAG